MLVEKHQCVFSLILRHPPRWGTACACGGSRDIDPARSSMGFARKCASAGRVWSADVFPFRAAPPPHLAAPPSRRPPHPSPSPLQTEAAAWGLCGAVECLHNDFKITGKCINRSGHMVLTAHRGPQLINRSLLHFLGQLLGGGAAANLFITVSSHKSLSHHCLLHLSEIRLCINDSNYVRMRKTSP